MNKIGTKTSNIAEKRLQKIAVHHKQETTANKMQEVATKGRQKIRKAHRKADYKGLKGQKAAY